MDDAGEQTDAQLLLRSRDGDRHAFSELWRRHAPVAVAYARSLGAAPPDPEDVVSEAFLSILRLLRAGKGPQTRFRPYLLTTVRNTWVSASRRSPATTSLDDAEHPPSTIGAIDVEAMVNSATLAAAFRSLPERWQHALWLSEVEQLPPRAIAEVLDLQPNAAAALTYRARDALRKAWIRAHLRHAPAGTEHARVIELLGSYAHDDLAPRSQRFVNAHLALCAECRAAAGEARHLARALTLGPLLAGGTGLVIAPLLLPADQVAAATLTAAPGMTGWLGAHAPALQPAAEAAGHANPLLWPIAATAAVALSVSGSLFVGPQPEPDALATQAPASVMPAPAAPAAKTDPVPDPVSMPTTVDSAAPRPVTTPEPAVALAAAARPFVERILATVKPPRGDSRLGTHAEEQPDAAPSDAGEFDETLISGFSITSRSMDSEVEEDPEVEEVDDWAMPMADAEGDLPATAAAMTATAENPRPSDLLPPAFRDNDIGLSLVDEKPPHR